MCYISEGFVLEECGELTGFVNDSFIVLVACFLKSECGELAGFVDDCAKVL